MNAKKEKMSAMILLDLDNFKLVNDTYGHDKGDEVLCKVSSILQGKFRETDCVARLGGDEFMVYLPVVFREEDIIERVEKILKEFPIVVGEGKKKVNVSVSIGVAFKQEGKTATYERLYRRSDWAMYKAKEKGKARAVVTIDQYSKETVISADGVV
jgi:diguanylate cyclase (GGDEF)-like protein